MTTNHPAISFDNVQEIQVLNACYKDIFLRNEAGMTILEDLAKFCEEKTNPYVEGSFDLTAQKCGKLAVMLYIRKKLAAPDAPRQTEVTNDGQ